MGFLISRIKLLSKPLIARARDGIDVVFGNLFVLAAGFDHDRAAGVIHRVNFPPNAGLAPTPQPFVWR